MTRSRPPDSLDRPGISADLLPGQRYADRSHGDWIPEVSPGADARQHPGDEHASPARGGTRCRARPRPAASPRGPSPACPAGRVAVARQRPTDRASRARESRARISTPVALLREAPQEHLPEAAGVLDQVGAPASVATRATRPRSVSSKPSTSASARRRPAHLAGRRRRRHDRDDQRSARGPVYFHRVTTTRVPWPGRGLDLELVHQPLRAPPKPEPHPVPGGVPVPEGGGRCRGCPGPGPRR